MADTAQTEINKLRIQLAETDPNNSRWDDPNQLLFYLNQGRREFAKESKSLKAEFKQTTAVGATPGNDWARYTIDPSIWDIDIITWDGVEVENVGPNEFDEYILAGERDQLGRTRVYRRVGDIIDLFPAPNEAKTLEVIASIFTTDFVLLTEPEIQLMPDQIQAAIDYATYSALADDDRDGRFYLNRFMNSTRKYQKNIKNSGPRFVNQMSEPWIM